MKLAVLQIISHLTCFILRRKGLSIGRHCMIQGLPKIYNKGGQGAITLRDNVTIASWKRINPIINLKTTFWIMNPAANIELHSGVGISSTTIVATNKIVIGENTIIGPDSFIVDNDLHAQIADGTWPLTNHTDFGSPVMIGKNCFIGARSILLKGASLGDNCIVSAGTVLRQHVPANHIAYGNPAIIKPRNSPQAHTLS